MIHKLELGVIEKDGKIINHRSLVKVLLNPFLRIFGYQLATIFYSHTNKLDRPTIIKCKKRRNINFLYGDTSFDYKVIKTRRFI